MVGKRCGHIFCNDCINNWRQQNSSCPSCRQSTSFEPVATRIVLSQVDRLLVRCRYCHRNNIERGNFNDHIQHQCRQVIVRCKAADLKCHWTGSREEEAQHADICPLLQIRPIVEELRAEIAAQAYQLQILAGEITHLQNQLIRSVSSSKSIISSVQDDSEEKRYQQLIHSMERTWRFNLHCIQSQGCIFCKDFYTTRFFKCMVCSCKVVRNNVRAHDSSSESCAVICLNCVSKYGEQNSSNKWHYT